MYKIGIIGSTGIKISLLTSKYYFKTMQIEEKEFRYYHGNMGDNEIILTTRNQFSGSIPPHKVDYKLIMSAMKKLEVDVILGTSVSGSLKLEIPPKTYIVLDQFIDFTKRNPFTAFNGDEFAFVDFSEPYCPVARENLIRACEKVGVNFLPKGCYIGVDGPRYETSAEVRMFNFLGGDVVGMTNVTEAIMARETGQCYASLSIVSNYGAGIKMNSEILRTDCYEKTIETLPDTINVLKEFVLNYNGKKECLCKNKIEDMQRK